MTKKDKMIEKMMRVAADKVVLAKGAPCTRILEVAITAPRDSSDQSVRPLDVALVLDRSGSMQGEKLHYAKQAAAHLVDMLSEKDRAAVVMYDSEIDVVSPSLQMTKANREQAKAAIQRITSRRLAASSGRKRPHFSARYSRMTPDWESVRSPSTSTGTSPISFTAR